MQRQGGKSSAKTQQYGGTKNDGGGAEVNGRKTGRCAGEKCRVSREGGRSVRKWEERISKTSTSGVGTGKARRQRQPRKEMKEGEGEKVNEFQKVVTVF